MRLLQDIFQTIQLLKVYFKTYVKQFLNSKSANFDPSKLQFISASKDKEMHLMVSFI